jgi:pSer/pThr/pTyr-binding forkhead associated (FHA) protein
MPQLVITKGPGVGRDIALVAECVIGRATDVDFILEDTLASRRHVRLSEEAGAWIVEDLGSRNGTLVNGQRVQRQAVNDGDVLRVGGTEMIFRGDVAAPAGAAKGVVVVPAVAVKAPAAAGAAPAGAPAEPAKKPMPKVVPAPRRRL